MTPDPNQQSSDLDRRYRLVLCSMDYIDSDEAVLNELLPEVNRKWEEIQQDIGYLLRHYPHLFAGLERRFRQEYPDRAFTVEEFDRVRLQASLQLNSEPYTGPYRAP